MTQGRVHSVESFGSADGPGVRYIVFLQGCPMRCRFCHNPDTWNFEGGELKEADEILDEAERYRRYWKNGGGITVSGGEALAQAEFVAELFEKAHERGINTCLDTSLAPYTTEGAAAEAQKRVFAAADLVMADIKHIDSAEHKKLTGRDNANILACLTWLAEQGQAMWIRHVLVPGITDNDDYLRRTRAFIESLGSSVERVEVLPYHTLGVFKWEELGIPYTLQDVKPPSKERVQNAEQILRGEI